MKLGFRSKIYLGTISLLLLLGIVIFFVVSGIIKEALLEENRNMGITTSANLAARIAEPMLAMDFFRMRALVDETVQLSNDIFYAFVQNTAGEPIVHTFKKGFPVDLKAVNTVADNQSYNIHLLDTGNRLIYDYSVPVIIDNNRFGTVRIGLLRTRIQQTINHLMWSAFLSTGFVILIAVFLGTVLVRPIIRRIKILHQSSEQALRGDLDVQTAPLLKKNCWEIMHCDRRECPAYGDYYHRCWYLAGTMCPLCVEGEYAKKIDTCRKCQVYRKCSGDEMQSLAESFDSMAMSLQTHLSELEQAEITLKEQRQLLKTVLDASPDYVSLQNRDLVFQAVNKSFCEMVGRREEEVVGKTVFDLFSKQEAEAQKQEDLSVIKSGKPLIQEVRIAGNGGNQWLHVVKIPVHDADGMVVGILCSGRDITELKKVQEQLTQAQKMQAVGELIAGIAHEINTPLGIILGYSQLLLEDAEREGQSCDDLKTIEKQTKICKKIVSDLLEFSRRTESTVTLHDINKSIEEVISVVGHTFSLDRIVIEENYDPNLPPVMGDKEKIKQVFVNLFNNAYDAIGSDGIISVATSFDKTNNEAVIYVADSGSGIPPEKIDRIFDPFFTTKPVHKGTGLGLSVTFGIIREHGGRIEVESPPSSVKIRETDEKQGTVFIIHLPVGDKLRD